MADPNRLVDVLWFLFVFTCSVCPSVI